MRLVSIWRRFKAKRHYYAASKSNIQGGDLTSAGIAVAAFVGGTIIAGVLSASGAATESAVGGATAVTTNSSAGTGAASFTGSGVITGVLSSTGTNAAAFSGVSVANGVLSVSGIGTASFDRDRMIAITTLISSHPVNAVMAIIGEASDKIKPPVKMSAAMLKRIFRE